MSESAVARFATADERARWEELLTAAPKGGEVWASTPHLEAKRFSKYRSRFVMVDRAGEPSLPVGILAKRVPLLGEWWNLMAGPEAEDEARTIEAAAAVAELARANGCFLMKIEPRLSRDSCDAILAEGYLPTVRRIPNESTVLVDLTGTEDELFARISKKARNTINRARREGVEVHRVPATDENCDRLFDLLRETADGRFILRPEGYFRTFWQQFDRAGQGQMFFAEQDGALLAGAYAIRLGRKTSYKDGASSREKTAYGVSHLLQWEVMRWAREMGATEHDLCGTPPSDRVQDREHELYGVGKFKRSFSSEVTDYVGAFELPLKPAAYRLWSRFGEPIARRLSLALRKDPYY